MSQYPGETAGYGNKSSSSDYEIRPMEGHTVNMGQPIAGQPVVGQPVGAYASAYPGGEGYVSSEGYPSGYPPSGYPPVASPVAYGQQPVYGTPAPMYAQQVQPGYVQTTVVVGGMGVAQAQPVQQRPPLIGYWSDGICDCFSDCESYCCACWCPCVRFGWTLQRSGLWTFGAACLVYLVLRILGELMSTPGYVSDTEPSNDPNNPDGTVTITPQWATDLQWVGFAATIVLVIVSLIFRMRIREKYQIPGNPCEDCLCHTFCTICALAQEARHVDRATGIMPYAGRV